MDILHKPSTWAHFTYPMHKPSAWTHFTSLIRKTSAQVAARDKPMNHAHGRKRPAPVHMYAAMRSDRSGMARTASAVNFNRMSLCLIGTRGGAAEGRFHFCGKEWACAPVGGGNGKRTRIAAKRKAPCLCLRRKQAGRNGLNQQDGQRERLAATGWIGADWSGRKWAPYRCHCGFSHHFTGQ